MVFMHVLTFLKLKRSLVASEGFLAFSNLASSSCTISSASEVYKYDIFIEFEIFSTNYTTHLWTCLQASKLLLFHHFPSLIFGLLWYGCPRQIQQHTHIQLEKKAFQMQNCRESPIFLPQGWLRHCRYRIQLEKHHPWAQILLSLSLDL